MTELCRSYRIPDCAQTDSKKGTQMITSENYVAHAVRTESPVFGAKHRLQDPKMIRLLHGAMGLCTEAGEFQDAMKRHIFYGKELDYVNLMEEVGDTCWYLAIILDALNMTFDGALEINIEKLKARYPERFTEELALNRNLNVERTVLENDRITAEEN